MFFTGYFVGKGTYHFKKEKFPWKDPTEVKVGDQVLRHGRVYNVIKIDGYSVLIDCPFEYYCNYSLTKFELKWNPRKGVWYY